MHPLHRFRTPLLAIFAALALFLPAVAGAQATVYVAQKIYTMDPDTPTATAVGVMDGKVLHVGSLDYVIDALRAEKTAYTVDDTTFAGSVLLPGFVEAHTHLQMYGLYSRLPYTGYFDRPGPEPGSTLAGVTTRQGVIDALKTAVAEQVERTQNPGLPLLATGADPIYFGGSRFTKATLDSVSTTTPILLNLGSGHIVVANSLMLDSIMANPGWKAIDTTTAVVRDPSGVPTGELDELAAVELAFNVFNRAWRRVQPVFGFFTTDRLMQAVRDGGAMMQRAGITTGTELLFGAPGRIEAAAARVMYYRVTAERDFPVRVVLGYNAAQVMANCGAEAVECMRAHRLTDNDMLRTGPMKVIFDGSIQGYTAELDSGYVNGNPGNPIWNVAPGDGLYNLTRPFWNAGFQLAVHVNGDSATAQMLRTLDRLQAQHRRADHRTTLEHNQTGRLDQYRAIKDRDVLVNLFANHVYYYGQQHVQYTLGPTRAAAMDNAHWADSLGIPFSLHSDAPVTPAQPLFAAWAAVNRIPAMCPTPGPNGCPPPGAQNAISVDRALWAITMGGAYLLNLEKEIGSIRSGKRADFVALGQDPYTVPAASLKDVPVRATVLGGRVQPVN